MAADTMVIIPLRSKSKLKKSNMIDLGVQPLSDFVEMLRSRRITAEDTQRLLMLSEGPQPSDETSPKMCR